MLDPLLREQPALLESNSATGLSNRVGIASGLRFCSPMLAAMAESG